MGHLTGGGKGRHRAGAARSTGRSTGKGAARVLKEEESVNTDDLPRPHKPVDNRNGAGKGRHHAGAKRSLGRVKGPSPDSAVDSVDIEGFPRSDTVSEFAVDINALTMDVPLSNKLKQPEKPEKKVAETFTLLDLPTELRLKVYKCHFQNTGDVLDLDHDNKHIHKKLALLRACRQVHHEASHLFYSSRPIRIFPIYGKFFRSKRPLLARLKPRQRPLLSTLELRLGPGWNRPPRGWVVNEALGLKECVSVRRLNVFLEIDPSSDHFNGWRKADGFYESFSRDLLQSVLSELPECQVVEFDANPSVKKRGALMSKLLEVATESGLRLAWGPMRGWTDEEEVEEVCKPVNNGPIGRAAGSMFANYHVPVHSLGF